MKSTRLVVVRHGETVANREFRYVGRRDDPLSAHGLAQAVSLAEALTFLPITVIYSSPLQRTLQTAQVVADQLAIPCVPLDGLIEQSFGTWEGLSRAEVLARSPQDGRHLLAWEQDPTLPPPEGESLLQVQQRTLATLATLVSQHSGQTIVLVSHVGPIKALLCAALNAPISSAFRLFLDPATISVVDWGQRPILRLFNSHAHLGWEQARWL